MVERVCVSPSVAWVDEDDRVVVVRLADPAADPLVLADSAAAVWRAVGAGASAEEVVGTVAASYDVEPAVVDADVRALLDDAVRAGILDAA